MRYLIFFLFFLGCEDVPMYSESDPVEEIRHVDTGEDKDTETDTVESILSETDTEIPTETEKEVDPSETDQETATETETETLMDMDTYTNTGTEFEDASNYTETETDAGRLIEVNGLMGGTPRRQCFYDTELEIDCCPWSYRDGTTRCLPANYAAGFWNTQSYTEECEGEQLARSINEIGIEHPDYIIAPVGIEGSIVDYEIYEIGQIYEGIIYQFDPVIPFPGEEQVCIIRMDTGDPENHNYWYTYGPQVDPAIFAEIQE